MIKSFTEARTERLWNTGKNRHLPPALVRPALRKLVMLDDAASLEDLAVLPGNRLERLRGERAGQHSIRVNDQFRVCFRWQDGNAYEVEIADYH